MKPKDISKIHLEKEIGKIEKPWYPVDITRINDQVIRLAKFDGKFHWHKHTTEDELFYVLKGEINIHLKDQPNIKLNEGEMVVIPKGIEHCPESEKPSYVLLFEPFNLKSKGD